MENKFGIRICSDLDYEELVADIHYEDQFLALISFEKDVNNMKIEIYSHENSNSWNLPLNDLIETINIAKKKLLQMQKIPESDDNA